MIDKVRNEFISISKKYEEKTSYNYWEEHVKYVVMFSLELADRVGADKEIVEISAILHDIAKVSVEQSEPHNIIGADLADEMLSRFGYEQEKIEKVNNCIIKHNGDVDLENLTKEEWCVRNADVLSMLDNLTIYFYLAYSECHMNYKDGKVFVKEMATNKYSKLDPKLKEEYKDRFEMLFESI